jgi:hypothetical protein
MGRRPNTYGVSVRCDITDVDILLRFWREIHGVKFVTGAQLIRESLEYLARSVEKQFAIERLSTTEANDNVTNALGRTAFNQRTLTTVLQKEVLSECLIDSKTNKGLDIDEIRAQIERNIKQMKGKENV